MKLIIANHKDEIIKDINQYLECLNQLTFTNKLIICPNNKIGRAHV